MSTPRSSSVAAIIPCNDIDAAERWWAQLGFDRAGDEAGGDYRMMSDGGGGEVHLRRAVEGWLVPGRNPFGLYLATSRVDDLARAAGGSIVGGQPSHKPWGMYECALNGPDDLLVRVGWPSRLMPPAD
jgi:hypothetical protein